MTTLYFWEVVCIGTVTHTKNYGQGIRRTVHSKQLIKSKNRLFTKKADAEMYLYRLKNSGYQYSYVHKYYTK